MCVEVTAVPPTSSNPPPFRVAVGAAVERALIGTGLDVGVGTLACGVVACVAELPHLSRRGHEQRRVLVSVALAVHVIEQTDVWAR